MRRDRYILTNHTSCISVLVYPAPSVLTLSTISAYFLEIEGKFTRKYQSLLYRQANYNNFLITEKAERFFFQLLRKTILKPFPFLTFTGDEIHSHATEPLRSLNFFQITSLPLKSHLETSFHYDICHRPIVQLLQTQIEALKCLDLNPGLITYSVYDSEQTTNFAMLQFDYLKNQDDSSINP